MDGWIEIERYIDRLEEREIDRWRHREIDGQTDS